MENAEVPGQPMHGDRESGYFARQRRGDTEPALPWFQVSNLSISQHLCKVGVSPAPRDRAAKMERCSRCDDGFKP